MTTPAYPIKSYFFTVEVQGYGTTAQEAFNNAAELPLTELGYSNVIECPGDPALKKMNEDQSTYEDQEPEREELRKFLRTLADSYSALPKGVVQKTIESFMTNGGNTPYLVEALRSIRAEVPRGFMVEFKHAIMESIS